jgi:serine/threonine protein kinase
VDQFYATYEVEEEIGRGTFGVVARARHRKTRELRAVKRVQSQVHRRASDACRAIGEVDAMARLNHPNVARLIEHFTGQEEVLMVQELCSGSSLEAHLQKHGRLTVDEAAVVLGQMLEAVSHCHKQGIVHRDLKADNFVFESPMSPDVTAVKLIDFGMAERCEIGQFVNGCAGTIEYSAPEVLGSDGAGFGLPADMWALGAVLFLMLTGEPLIKVENPRSPDEEARQRLRQEAREKVCGPQYVRLRLAAVSTRIPYAALDLLESLLARDPTARMTAEEALRHPFLQKAAVAGRPRSRGSQ